MSGGSCIFEVYEGGPLTVVGFGGRSVLEGFSALDCRDELARIIDQHKCRTLAIDMTGVKLVPSGVLGLMASVKKSGIDVLVFNPGHDIREVMEITKLDTILDLFQVDVN